MKRNDIGKICEVTDEEVEQMLPDWAITVNEHEKKLEMDSLRCALGGFRRQAIDRMSNEEE